MKNVKFFPRKKLTSDDKRCKASWMELHTISSLIFYGEMEDKNSRPFEF